MSFGDRVPVDRLPEDDRVPVGDSDTRTQPAFRRALVPVEDASQAEQVVELARRAGVGEARVLHLSLRENIGGRRFAIEKESAAAHAVEATVLELGMAGIQASGQVRHVLVGRAAEAIVAEATEWGADLIVLGFPRRGEFMTRLFGSVTLRVLQHAPCPALVASTAAGDRLRLHRAEESVRRVTGPDSGAGHDHPARVRSDDLSTAPVR